MNFISNSKLTLVLVDELLECGVEVFFVNDSIWTRNTDDYFKLTIMAQYAEQESRKVSERVFSGQAIARENGVLFGNGNILGYDLIKGKKSKETTYIINEEQAKTVRLIYELALKGYGAKKIKRYLQDNGYKTATGVKVPEALIETYINSIKVCGNNIIEYNIRINPEVPIELPVIPDEEFNPQIHSAKKFLDSSQSSLIAEFEIDYEDAKEYANKVSRKVKRVHFDKPVVIRIYADI